MSPFGKWVQNHLPGFLTVCSHTSPEICLLTKNVNVVVNETKYKHDSKYKHRKACKGVMVKIVMEIEMDRNAEVFCKGEKK